MKGMKFVAILVLTLAAAVTVGAKGPKAEDAQKAEATLLDHSEYPCRNCFLGNSDYYFCFDVNSKILIGHEKIRVQTRRDGPPEELLNGRGQKVTISYDNQYIWVTGAKGKEQRLTQDYTKSAFVFSNACKRAVKGPAEAAK
jgi:hypothetical protein